MGVDLWNSQTSDGRGLRKALDFLVPYVTGAKKWPYRQIEEYKVGEIIPVMLAAADRYHAPGYAEAAAKADPAAAQSFEAMLIRSKKRD